MLTLYLPCATTPVWRRESWLPLRSLFERRRSPSPTLYRCQRRRRERAGVRQELRHLSEAVAPFLCAPLPHTFGRRNPRSPPSTHRDRTARGLALHTPHQPLELGHDHDCAPTTAAQAVPPRRRGWTTTEPVGLSRAVPHTRRASPA